MIGEDGTGPEYEKIRILRLLRVVDIIQGHWIIIIAGGYKLQICIYYVSYIRGLAVYTKSHQIKHIKCFILFDKHL